MPSPLEIARNYRNAFLVKGGQIRMADEDGIHTIVARLSRQDRRHRGRPVDRRRLRGDTKPVAPNTTDEGRAQNRRVEIVKK